MSKLGGEDTRLEEQRHLLKKSIAEFAEGDLAEAVRMAVSLRVLVHETGRQKPLLAQINSNYLQLEVPDEKREENPQEKGGVRIMAIPIGIEISEKGVRLKPKLQCDVVPSIIGRWWTRPCLILPGLGGYSRKEVVLGLADKEGGAHVGTDLPERYRRLLESKQFQIGWNKEGVSPLNLSRCMTAQAAVELLASIEKNFFRNG